MHLCRLTFNHTSYHRRYSSSDDGTDARNRPLANRVGFMPGHQLFLESHNRCINLLNLNGEHLQYLARQTR